MRRVPMLYSQQVQHFHVSHRLHQLKKNLAYRPQFEFGTCRIGPGSLAQGCHLMMSAEPVSHARCFDMRKDARDIFLAALKAVSPNKLVEQALKLDENGMLQLPDQSKVLIKNNVYVAAFGLSAIPMARGAEDALGTAVVKGYVSSPTGISENLHLMGKDEWLLSPLSKLQVCDGASQKKMDKNAEMTCKRIMSMVSVLDEKDVLLVLLSGGGERLLPAPTPGVLNIDEKQRIADKLYSKGATNAEVMIVLKHLSIVKGGQLAKLASRATIVTFALSSMLENCLDLIAGGPTVPMYDTAHAALSILDKYGVKSNVPVKVVQYLEEQKRAEDLVNVTSEDFDSFLIDSAHAGAEEVVAIAPASAFERQNDFTNVHNFIVGDNEPALIGAQKFAESRGYFSYSLSNKMRTESLQLGVQFAAMANYMCEIFETRRTKYAINVLLGDLEFELIQKFGMRKQDITAINKLVAQAYNKSQPLCICAGGELLSDSNKATYAINQEVALSCAVELDRLKREKPDLFDRYDVMFLSCDSDGNDGTTPYAGALAYPSLIEAAEKHGAFGKMKLDLKESSEFYAQFQNGSDAVHTGLTGLSIMNVFLLLVKCKESITML